MELLTVHGTLDRYHRQIWTESRGNPAVPHVFEIMDCSNQVIHLGPISGLHAHCYLFILSESIFFLRIRKSGEISADIGENVEGSIQMWI